MNICIFDTETTSVDKPFCYNVGYIIFDTDLRTIHLRREYVIEQIWHNPELFHTAYYAGKRPIYVSAMRSRQAIMEKWGYVCQQMIRDFHTYDVSNAFAYNSDFDDKVFAYNCDWFKTQNPFDNIAIHDIRGHAIRFICGDAYKQCAESQQWFTDSGNYSTTAENVYRFITGQYDFAEAHTALDDARIEAEILTRTIDEGAEWTTDYPIPVSLPRKVARTFTVCDTEGKHHVFPYYTKTFYKSKDKMVLK